jgi:hypothetical protein
MRASWPQHEVGFNVIAPNCTSYSCEVSLPRCFRVGRIRVVQRHADLRCTIRSESCYHPSSASHIDSRVLIDASVE